MQLIIATSSSFQTVNTFLGTLHRVGQQLLGQLRHPHPPREVPRQAQHQQQPELHRLAALHISVMKHLRSCLSVRAAQTACGRVLLPTVLCLSVETLAPPVKHTASFKIKNAKCHLHPKLSGRTEDRGRTLGPGLSSNVHVPLHTSFVTLCHVEKTNSGHFEQPCKDLTNAKSQCSSCARYKNLSMLSMHQCLHIVSAAVWSNTINKRVYIMQASAQECIITNTNMSIHPSKYLQSTGFHSLYIKNCYFD